jgi:hypothetical protein
MIESKCLAGSNYLITNPQIIRISVIKKKFVDQMDYWHIKIDDPPILATQVEFLGQVNGHIICRFSDSRLKKISAGDLIGCYVEELSAERDPMAIEKAKEIIDQIPQLFAD